jgi:hypothetical protein
MFRRDFFASIAAAVLGLFGWKLPPKKGGLKLDDVPPEIREHLMRLGELRYYEFLQVQNQKQLEYMKAQLAMNIRHYTFPDGTVASGVIGERKPPAAAK